MLVALSGLLTCAVIIFAAGKKLSYYGDLLAELTGLGKAWIGLILMAAVTSLPELMVGISASAIVQSADLAVGDILGSCAFNLGILSLMDAFLPRERPLFGKASRSHALAAALGTILVSIAGLGLFLDRDFVLMNFPGLSVLSLFAGYLIAVRILFYYQKTYPLETAVSDETHHELTLKQVSLRYTLYAVIIIITALFLPHFADQLANATGLGKSFVGTLFLAGSTSLPEIAVSLAAVRMGSSDLAIGNLLGSNLFNVLILFLDDIFYSPGHLLQDASDVNLATAFFVIIMSGVAVIGIVFNEQRKNTMLSLSTFTIFGLYLVNMTLLFLLTNGS